MNPGDILTDRNGERWKVLRVKRDVADLAHLTTGWAAGDDYHQSGITATVPREELAGWQA